MCFFENEFFIIVNIAWYHLTVFIEYVSFFDPQIDGEQLASEIEQICLYASHDYIVDPNAIELAVVDTHR